jgi:adenylate cyclase
VPARPDVRLSLLRDVGLATIVSAGFVFVYFSVLFRNGTSAGGWSHEDTVSLVVFAAFMILTTALSVPQGAWQLKRVLAWEAQGRQPDQAEVANTLAIPASIARISFTYWAIAAVVFGALNVVYGNAIVYVIRITVGIFLGGLTSSALVYLLVERRLRPMFARALAGVEPSRGNRLSVGRRVILAWVLGSAIPLLGIALAPISRETGDGVSVVPLVALAIAGLVGGGVLITAAARSVAMPLEELRAATGRLQQGDLSTSIIVDDGGEIGMLQAGFNRMISGLRDQARIRELFGRYVGADVAREALDRDVHLGGELREVSVLFVDLIGSTAMAQRRPPTEVVALLNRFFANVVREIEREGGWVNKFEGDGALCIFGAPVPQPDHATRALRAARSIATVLLEAGDLDAGTGVSAGLVVAGNIGAEERYEYTVIGDPVNEAARLTDLAKAQPARTLASEAVVTAAGPAEAQHWRRVGAVELRGRNRPTVVYEPASTGADASALVARSTPSSSTS